ncbi:MAG TPA: hypothetical protein VIG51_04255 [Candidatus Baltobacteraceae bacterium]|jgi:hypothetical protein
MELFGTKFTFSLGSWKLRFVLMLEDDMQPATQPAPTRHAHHVAVVRDRQGVR